MRLAILNLTGGGVSGGHKKYLSNILPRIAAAEDVEGVLCASPASLRIGEWMPQLPGVIYADCEPFRPFRHSPGPILNSLLGEFRPDVLFFPVERFIHYGGVPAVIMLQNMAPLTRQKTGIGLRDSVVSLLRGYETRYALKRADQVIVPTHYVRDFLIQNRFSSDTRTHVVYYGSSGCVVGKSPRVVPDSRFIFTAGSFERYRGLEDLIDVMPMVREKHPDMVLVVAGATRPATEAYLSGLKLRAEHLGVGGAIQWLGHIGQEELAWYYSNASVVALTSRMESFCFVALEAMAQGAKIVSASAACLPEVLGAAADYYVPGDVRQLAETIVSKLAVIVPGPESLALARAAKFSWDEAALGTLDILRRAMSSRR